MQNLIPHFIHGQFSRNRQSGSFEAATLFVDISGFTHLTETLMQHRKDGAEVVSGLLNRIFAPLVAEVYARGGFITTFAGDAFTAVFPKSGLDNHVMRVDEQAPLQALHTAFFIQDFFVNHGRIETRYGVFSMGVKVGLSVGTVVWGILGAVGQYIYFFRGQAVDACAQAEHYAATGEIVADTRIWPYLASYVEANPIVGHPNHFKLLSLVTEIPLPRVEPPAPLGRTDLFLFVQDQVLDLKVPGEFRTVASVFISLQEPQNPTLLNSFVYGVLNTAKQYGGTLVQVDFGDKGGVIVILFGAPITHENDPERAAEFILALRDRNSRLKWRASITYGTIYAGFRGGYERSEYSGIGDVMNTASRIVMRARWEETWTSEAVYEVLSDAYHFETLGTFFFKGKSEDLPVYRLLGKKERAEKVSYSGRIVCRESELAQLVEFVSPIFEGKFAGVATIYGDAGMGKSRLVYEVQQHVSRNAVSQHGTSLRYFTCPAEEILRQSLNPFRRCLRKYFEQSADLTLLENRKRFENTLDRLIAALLRGSPEIEGEVMDAALELERVRSVLAALVNLRRADSLYERLDPELRFENMLSAFKTFVKANSMCQPVLLVVENAQWIDSDSLGLIKKLVRNIPSYPIAIMIASRYERQMEPLTLDEDVPQLVIELKELTHEGVADFAEQLLDGPVSASLTDVLLEKTGGNPFFIEQLTLDLRERGVLVRESGRAWQLRTEENVGLPATVNAVLMARLDRLVAQVRDVVLTASVLGREFPAQVLSVMLRNDAAVLDGVKRAESEGIWSTLSEMHYLFQHTLLRDVAYDMQLRTRLRELHTLAAQAIQEVYADDLSPYYADLAYHYDQAEDYDQAVKWHRLAGERAATQYANTEAITHLNRALELTSETAYDARYTLLLTREKVHDLLGNRKMQRRDLEQLEAVVDILSGTKRRIVLLLRRANYAEVTGEYEMVIALAQDAIARSREVEDFSSEVSGHILWGRGLWRQGNLPAARVQLAQSLRLLNDALPEQRQDIALQPLQADNLNSLGIVLVELREYDKAIPFLSQALELYQDLDQLRGQAKVLNNLGSACLFQKDYAGAQQYLHQTLEIAHAIGDRRSEGIALGNLGLVAYNHRDYAEARSYYERALRIRHEIGDRSGQSVLLNNMGIVAAEQGDYPGARFSFKQALLIRQKLGDLQGQSQALNNLGRVSMLLGDYEEAQSAYRRALELCKKMGDQQTKLDVLENLGLLSHYQEDNVTAEKYCRKALKAARELEDRESTAEIWVTLGHALSSMGRRSEAIESYEHALKLRESRDAPHLASEALAGLADLAMMHNAVPQALTYVTEILSHLDSYTLDGLEDPFRVYLTCSRVLRACDDPRAQGLLETARAILQARAERINDPALRRLFLQNVPSHCALIAALTNAEES